MKATEAISDLLTCLVFKKAASPGLMQTEEMLGHTEAVVTEISQMKEEMRRMNKAIEDIDARNEVAVLRSRCRI